MKLSIATLFGSSKRSAKKRTRSISRSDDTPSFGSSSDASTPKTVLPTNSPFSLSDLFSVFDRDGDGKISKSELEFVLRRLGPDPLTDDELASIVAEVDRDGDGCISLEELGAIGSDAFDPPACGSELREAFAVFDADGDGKISAEELLGVFVTLGDGQCTIDDCRRMIGVVDGDGDGFVGFEDFVKMMDGQR